MEIPWESIGAMVAVSAFITGLGFGALALFVDNRILKLEKSLTNHFDSKYATRESVNDKIANLKREQ